MRKSLLLGMSAILLWGCNSTGKNTSEENVEHRESHAEHHDRESTDALELDNGKRWMVNKEMKPFVTKGEELVNMYIHDGQTDYKALAERLKDQNNQLIQSCTMTGKSHDELHKWLHPHLALVQALEDETNVGKTNDIVSLLQASYTEYHEYFQ